MEIIALVTYGFLLLRFVITLINFITKPLLPIKQHTGYMELVSILVPARNEADTLPFLFESISKQAYTHYELLVLDDSSADTTADVVKRYMLQNHKCRLVGGKPLPEGWLGKNWACHQLAREARGKYLLFIDADVRLQPCFIESALYEIQHKNLALLSVFNDQIMQSMGEKLVVPLMHYILLILLPVRLVFHTRDYRLAAASGQCMFFQAAAYQKFLFHQAHKGQVAEDISIMRYVKKQGLKGSASLANGLIQCRMYNSYNESIQGFSKNLIAGFDGKVLLSILVVFLCTLGYLSFLPFLPFMGEVPKEFGYLLIGTAVFFIMGIRIMVSLLGNQPVFSNIILHPLQMVSFFILLCSALYKHFTNTNQWKGRVVITK